MSQYSFVRLFLVKIYGDIIFFFICLRDGVMFFNADIQNTFSNKARLRRKMYSCKIIFRDTKHT